MVQVSIFELPLLSPETMFNLKQTILVLLGEISPNSVFSI